MERKGESERGCTGTAPVAEMSGSGYTQGGKWRPKTLYVCGGEDMEEDILRDERRKEERRGRREDGGEKDRKAVRKEGEEGREGGEEGGRRE
jgi:hypothetical protein